MDSPLLAPASRKPVSRKHEFAAGVDAIESTHGVCYRSCAVNNQTEHALQVVLPGCDALIDVAPGGVINFDDEPKQRESDSLLRVLETRPLQPTGASAANAATPALTTGRPGWPGGGGVRVRPPALH